MYLQNTHTLVFCFRKDTHLGLIPPSGKTSYSKILWSLEAARLRFTLFQSLWNLAGNIGSSTAEMPDKFQSDTIIEASNLVVSRLHEISRLDLRLLSE